MSHTFMFYLTYIILHSVQCNSICRLSKTRINSRHDLTVRFFFNHYNYNELFWILCTEGV